MIWLKYSNLKLCDDKLAIVVGEKSSSSSKNDICCSTGKGAEQVENELNIKKISGLSKVEYSFLSR